jgi:amidase
VISDKTLQKALDKQPKCTAIVDEYLTDHDVLITPGLAIQQLPVGKFAGKGALWTFNGVAKFTPFTAPFNMTGHPGINIPAGFDADGLPLSVQIVGRPNSERQLISIAAQLEQAMPWADKTPSLPA